MRISFHFGLLLLARLSSAALHPRNHDTHQYYALQLQPGSSPEQIASALGLQYEGKLGQLPDHHTFSSPRLEEDTVEEVLESLRKRRRKRESLADLGALGNILWSQKQKPKPRMHKRDIPVPPAPVEKRQIRAGGGGTPDPQDVTAVSMRDNMARQLSIADPIFPEQWHLFNTIQVGHDLNVTGVWTQGITGHNVTAVMVDDGIDMYSNDIKDNYFAKGSYDFNDDSEEPKPRLSDDKHGTRCAGEIAAVRNGVCGVGVAYDAKIGGIRILSKVITDEDEAVAMNYAFQENQIYSCSWGPPDDGRSMDAPGILIKKAMVNAVQNGRQGKGTIYVFAAGNGAGAGDNCNFDGYTNSIYSITIGGIDRKDLHPYYSEQCSAQLAVTYSSGSGDAIHTTDVGLDKCYSNHGGTSAAAPLGAGVFALALSVRPELTWRDMQELVVRTAVPFNNNEDWDTTSIGKLFSHTYGYGKLDAYAFVEAAKSLELLNPQAWYKSPWMHVKHPIPQGVEGLLSSFEVTKESLKKANLKRVEHVTVTMNINHTRRGDLSVELRSPGGMVSHLSVVRRLDDAPVGYKDWTFMSVAHWGENGLGTWSIVAKDTLINDHNGTLEDWRLTLWGECGDASKQDLLPMPSEHDDDDHDVMLVLPSLVSVSPGPSQTGLLANPTDHQHRPVNAKPTAVKPSPSPTVSSAPDTAGSPSPSVTSADSFLPHYFPTFGVSKRTQIWIYGSVAIIVLFCAGLGTYFYIQRRRRRRSDRDNYEFDVLEDEDEAATGLTKVGKKGKRPTRRGGELYDAFAGESDEELLSEDEAGAYRDEALRPDSPDRNTGSNGAGEFNEKR